MASLDSTTDEVVEVRTNIDIHEMNDHGHSAWGNVHPNYLENVLPTRQETSENLQLHHGMEHSANSQRNLASRFESELYDLGIDQSILNTNYSSSHKILMNESSTLTETRVKSNFDNEPIVLSPSSNIVYYEESHWNRDDNMYSSYHHPDSLYGEDRINLGNLYPTFLAEDERSMNSRVCSQNFDADTSIERRIFRRSHDDPSPPRTSYDGVTGLSHDMDDAAIPNFENRNLMREDLTYFNGYNSAAYPVSNINYSIPRQNDSSNQYPGEHSFEIATTFQGTPFERPTSQTLGMSNNYSEIIRESIEGYDAHSSFLHSPSFADEAVHELYRLILQTRADDYFFRNNENRCTSESWELVRNYILTTDFDLVNAAARITSPGGLTPLHQACRHDPPDDIIELFVTFAGPDILQLQDGNDMLPLHHACIHTTSESVIEILVQGYPDGLLVQDSKGFTPLHYSVTNLATSSRIVEKVCVQGAVAALDRDGTSPLHFATIVSAYFKPSIINILVLAHPQGLTCPDREGRIPARYLARSCHDLEVVQILEQAIATDPSLCKDDMALILLKGLVDCVKKVDKSINIQRLLDIILEHNPEPSHAFTLTLKTLPSWLLSQRVERPEKSKKSLFKVISKSICFLKKSKKKALDKSEKTIYSE